MNKKILFFLCLIAFIVSIAGVSATDDVNQTVSNDLTDTLGVSLSDVEIVGGADGGTFEDLQKKIDAAKEGAVIILENDYVADYSDDVIGITKTITINGNGYAIDGKGYDKIFYINSASVTLNNITLKTSYPYGNYGFGGAIYATNSDLTITNSVFTNHCIYENDDDGFGGAIYVEDSVLTVKNSNFTNNFASQRGGAIYGYDSTIEVVGCYFADNEARAYGGAIYSTTDDVRIINTTFINNSPNDFSPDDIYTENILRSSYIDLDMDRKVWITSEDISIGINLNDGTTGYVTVNIGGVERTLNVTDSSASLVVSDLNVGSYDVLVKYLGDDSFSPSEKSTSFKVVEATFRDLQELIDDADDGAIIELDKNYTYAVSIDNEKPIHIRKNLRINGNGYTLDANKENLIFDIDDCDVTLNNINFKNGVFVDYRNGGAIVIDDANVTIIDCNFTDNGGDDEAGGVIYAVNTILTVSNSIFTNNLAFYGGGAILGEYSTVELNACEFTGNGVEYAGGAIDIYEGNLTVNDCSFTDNYAVEKGGAIFIDQGNLTVNACNFIDNRALMGEGGAIYTYSSDLKVQDSSFENNTDYTSAIYMRGGKYDISNTTFTNNPNLTYLKLDIYLNVYNWEYTIFYPESQTVYIDTDRFDKYTVFINDEFYKVIEIKKDNYELVLNNLKPGDYKITVMFKGNDEFEAKNSTTYFEVKMLSPIELEIEKDIVITGENQSITVSLPKSATGDVQLWLNDDCYDSSEINNGQAVFNLTDLTADKYEVRVNYYGDEIYVSNSTGGEFHVLDPDTISVSAEDTTNLGTLHIDIYVGTLLSVNVAVKVGSNTYYAVAVNGYACIEINNLKTGKYKIIATYKNSKATTTVKVRDATFTDLQNAIDALAEGETLYLNGDVKRTWIFDEDEWEDNPESEIHINKAITIDGMGYAIDGEEGGRIFNITSDNVILKNITFTNALPVSPDDIENEYNGGAVAIYANNVVISDCYFIGNGIDGPGDGGAIYCEGDLTVINSCFEENEISGDYYDDVNGAAISIVGDLTVINSNFTSNHVSVPQGSSNGGAIYSTGTVNISDSTFTGNYISGQYIGGGAVSAIAVNIENSVFNDNYVKASSYDYWEGLASRGGAIYAGVVNVKNSDFTNNSASGHHSGDSYYDIDIYVQGGAIAAYDITDIENSNFKDNAADEGEALWAYALYASIDDDTTFTNNDYVLVKVYPEMSINISSPIFNVGDDVKIIVEFNKHVIGNVAIRVNDDERIVEVIDDLATLTLSDMAKGTYNVNATFIENEYCDYASVTDKFKVIDVPFATFAELQGLIDNAKDGDTIYLTKYYIYDKYVDEDSLHINKNITIMGNGNTIDGNDKHILSIYADKVVLKDITFINGFGMSAGAIYIYGNLDVINCIFENNTITERGIYPDQGGAIYSEGNLNVINSSFRFNKAPLNWNGDCMDYGGAIYSYGNLTVINSLFVGNTASYGGAIRGDNVVAINSIFINNTATHKPGAIDAYNNQTIINCTFENNIPNDYKHDLYMYVHYDKSLYRENDDVTIFVNVYDKIKSVKIDVSGTVKTVDIVNETARLTLNNCDAGIYNVIVSYDGDDYYDSKTVKSSFNVIDDSYATFTELQKIIDNATDGDTIVLSKNYIYDYEIDGHVLINKNIAIRGNGHIIDGNRGYGSFELNADNVLLDNLIFTNFNYIPLVEYDYNYFEYPDANLTITNCIFENNFNSVIRLYHTNLTVISSSFINNEVGTSVILGPSVNIINSNFKNNTGDAPSSHVCSIFGQNVTVKDSIFEDNTYAVGIDLQVFDIYCRDTLFVDGSTFINNSTDMNDYIYVESGRKTITNSKFINKGQTPGTANINIFASDINVGEDLIVDVLVSDDATGRVTLSINNKNYTKDLVNSKARFTVSGLSAGTYDIIVYYSGDATFNATQASTKVKVSEADTVIISVPDVNVAYKDPNGELVATITTEQGKPLVVNLNFNFNGNDYTVKTDSNGRASLAIGTLSPGTYTATISYKGSEKYKASSTTAKVTVTKADTAISAPDVNVAYNDPSGELVATIVNEHGKPLVVNLNINFNGEDYTVKTDSEGQTSIAIGTLKPGTYTTTISYKGSSNYKASTATAKVTVTKAGTTISAPNVNVAYKDPNGELVATITNEHGKPLVVNLNVNFNGEDYTVKTDSDGRASLAIGTLSPGTYTATISYKGSSNYKASTATAKVTVTKSATIISAPDVNIAYKDPNGELVATITNEHGKPLVVNLNVNFNGKDYTVKTDSDGQAILAIGTLSPGTYTATISYKGSTNYKDSTATAKVTVTKAGTTISAPNVNVAYKDPSGELVATITNEHGKPLVVNLNVNFNGKDYTIKTDSNGQMSLAIGTLSPGTYTATISYKGSSNYKASTATAKVTVTKSATVISAPDVNIAYKDPNGALVATITNEHGKPLVVNLNVDLNGKTYTVKTDSNGQASIAIDTLTPGTYTATISYKGSSNYKASSATAKVTVTKSATVISAPDVNIAYKDPNGQLVATITNEHGKPLVVNLNIELNGKTYTVKTDSNGQASIPIGTLTPGTYTATISYKGSSNYKATTTTAKVTVTKSATVISAQDVSVKYKDPNGKLVSTITNEHGKPLVVNLNVDLNGKTYTAKTDSNGQISVSTADLAPGTYTATISYKGSNNYKATSTTAKITVKQ
ncbi:Ig-like domain repeat protein [Methanobrevibacter sp.]|uniref:Ig-like domain repeat protein n=1 Tax=Methanobrevibacter sp. TaxID=66852 RepID=UPI00388FFB16